VKTTEEVAEVDHQVYCCCSCCWNSHWHLKDQIPSFRRGLMAAAKVGGYCLNDAGLMFSTNFIDEMFNHNDNDDAKASMSVR